MATQAQYIAEFNNLRSQAFWDGVNSEQLKTIAALSLISAAAGGSTSDATAANQVTGNNSLSSIDTKLTNNATTTLQTAGNTSLATIATNSGTQSTASNQTAGNTSLSSIDTKLTNNATTTLQATGNTSLSSIDTKLGTTLAADIAAIKTNTAKISQFSFQLAEDTAGTVFLIKTDTVAGTSVNINVATGLAFTPVGAIELTDPIASQITIEQNEYEALTTNGANWTVGDILERIRTLNTSSGVVLTTNWYNAAGTLLGTIPVIGTDVIDSDKQSLVVLRSIDNKTPTVGQKISANSSPVVVASDNIITAKTDQTTHGTTDKVAADNIQINGVAIATALGSANTGTQRVAVANDSRIVPWDGVNSSTYKAGATNPAPGDTAEVVTLRPVITSQSGGVNPAADTALTAGARVRGILFTNTTATVVFIGIYSSAAALTVASVPNAGYIIRVPAGATLDKGVADFGETGRLFAANTRIGLSTSLLTFTPLSAPNLLLCSLNVEVV
jgi:hypothetical protein